MTRDIITIDEKKCTGCGLCVNGCPEGALQLIDGKARLVGDLYCDGLGACIGECPEGAITVERREAEAYDENRVMENVVKQGKKVIKAHLDHLAHHHADAYHAQALAYLKDHGYDTAEFTEKKEAPCACLGSMSRKLGGHNHGSAEAGVVKGAVPGARSAIAETALTHWPIQLHLINPEAGHYKKSDLLLAADCTAFAMGGFHSAALSGKTLAIACPKLDAGKDIYVSKLRALIDRAAINTMTVMVMEVPCCSGLVSLAREAISGASRKVPLKIMQISVEGEIQREEWS